MRELQEQLRAERGARDARAQGQARNVSGSLRKDHLMCAGRLPDLKECQLNGLGCPVHSGLLERACEDKLTILHLCTDHKSGAVMSSLALSCHAMHLHAHSRGGPDQLVNNTRARLLGA